MKIKVLSKSLFVIVVLVAGQFSFGMEGEQKSVPLHIIPVDNGFSIQNIQLRDNEKTIDLLLLKENKPYLGQYNLESKSYNQDTKPAYEDSKVASPSTQSSYNSLPKQVGPYTLDYNQNSIHLFKKATQEQSKKLILFVAGKDKEYEKLIVINDENIEMLKRSKNIESMLDLDGVDNVNSAIPLHDINSQEEFDHFFKFLDLANKNSIENEKWKSLFNFLGHSYESTIEDIETELNKLSINQLCSLAKNSNYYDINCYCNTLKKDIRLTEIICKAISNKYIPITDQACIKQLDQACIKQLEFDLENMIARYRVEPCIKYIDNDKKPLSICKGRSSFFTLSPDGTLLLNPPYIGGTIIMNNEKTRQPVHTFRGHTNTVNVAAFSPNGEKIASGSYDRTIKVWDIKTEQCLKTFNGHIDEVTAVAFSQDGTKIASGSWDRTVKIWDLKTEQCLHTFTGHMSDVSKVAFSKNDTKVASVSMADKLRSIDNTVKIWNIKTEQCLRTIYVRSQIVSITFAQNDKTVVIVTHNGVQTWDIDPDETKQKFLNTLTIEQADLLTAKIYPAIQKDKKFTPTNNEEHTILMSIPSQKYLQGHVNFSSISVGKSDLSDFFDKPFFYKERLWIGLGSFVTAVAALFCYYTYFKRIANIL